MTGSEMDGSAGKAEQQWQPRNSRYAGKRMRILIVFEILLTGSVLRTSARLSLPAVQVQHQFGRTNRAWRLRAKLYQSGIRFVPW